MTDSAELDAVRYVLPPEWGKDHWSMLAYVEVRCVDHAGQLDKDHMRTNPRRHPGLLGPRVRALALTSTSDEDGKYKYPTQISGGVVEEHDDWDCFYDLERAGMLVDEGTGLHPRAVLTDKGRELAAELRKHKAAGRSFSDFKPNLASAG